MKEKVDEVRAGVRREGKGKREEEDGRREKRGGK